MSVGAFTANRDGGARIVTGKPADKSAKNTSDQNNVASIASPASRIIGTKAPFGRTKTTVIAPPPVQPPTRPAKPSQPAAGKAQLRPIKVDNWGIFLLTRLQNYFQKKELCDLTIRFPQRNAQIKVHRLVINACTEYFSGAEKEGKLVGRYRRTSFQKITIM
jgi:hypothetical protein